MVIKEQNKDPHVPLLGHLGTNNQSTGDILKTCEQSIFGFELNTVSLQIFHPETASVLSVS